MLTKKIIPYVIFISFFIFLIFSNHFDWDHFLSFFEVELRSWLVDHEPPLWTYQLCGGVTRLGDPQAFGLSPIFLIIALLGSFWGSKVMVFGCFIIGFFYSKKIVSLVIGEEDRENNFIISNLFSLLFIFSNFFLWQIHHGHLTISLMMLALGLIYYSLKTIVYEMPLTRKEILVFILIGWTHFSGGLYHSSLFLVMPFSLALAAYMALKLLREKSTFLKLLPLRQLIISALAILALSSYKLWGIINYQRQFPRTVTSVHENIFILDWFKVNFIPTFDYKLIVGTMEQQLWGIWEYSSFSIIYYLVILVLLERFMTKRNFIFSLTPPPIIQFSLMYLVLTFMLALGNFSKVSPLYLLNTFLLNNSVRVSGRYSVGVLLAVLLILSSLINKTPRMKKIVVKFGYLLASLIVLNFLTFRSTMSKDNFLRLSGMKPVVPEQMKYQSIVPMRDQKASYMYPAVMVGVGVLNCYEPLTFERALISEAPGKPFEKLSATFLKSEPQCQKESYFTQNTIFLDTSCDLSKSCLNLNMVNPGSRLVVKICNHDELIDSLFKF